MAPRSDRDRHNPITPKSRKARELDREPIRGFPSGPGAPRAATGRIHDCILDHTTIIKTLALEGASIHARSVLHHAAARPQTKPLWHVQVMRRRNRNVAAVALANKNARTMWAILT